MHRGSRRRHSALVLVTAVATLAASCGGARDDGASSGSAPASGETSPAGPSAAGILPDVTVRDVTDDVDVSLRDYEPGAKPILYWFWAPH